MIASKLEYEVELDVVPLDIYGIILASPYLYDRKEVLFFHEKKYHLTKDEVEYIVRAHYTKVNANFLSAGQMKRLINSNKGCMIMVMREKDVETSEDFQGCDATHKKELYEIVSKHDGIFQESSSFPP